VIRSDRARLLRWTAKTRRRRLTAGLLVRSLAPLLPRRQPPRAPVFVIGAPRSGTTMLFGLLDRSPHLASLGVESHLLWDMYHPIERSGWISHAVDAQGVKGGERRALAWTIDRVTGGTRYLDKFPRNCLRVPYLNALYPDAVFVYIRRDGRAAVSSLISAWRTPGRFGAGTALPTPISIAGYSGTNWKFLVPPGWREYTTGHTLAEVCAFQWVSANAAVLDARAAIDPARWIDLSYEDLVASAPARVAEVLERLQLPPDGVMEWASELPAHVSRTATTAPRPDKWRDENPAEVESVLPVIAPIMQRLGYGNVLA
jgi:hypothetical protein